MLKQHVAEMFKFVFLVKQMKKLKISLFLYENYFYIKTMLLEYLATCS